MTVCLALALLLAQTAPGAGGQPRQSFWALVVNEVPKGEIVAVMDGDGDRMWLPVAALEKAGLRRLEGWRQTLFGQAHVLLGSLEPDITAKRDMQNVAIRLTAAARHFDETRISLQRARPDGIVYSHSPSAFINYSATWDRTAGTSGFTQVGASLFGNTSISSDISVDDGKGTRGLTTATTDRPSARQRFQMGDVVATAVPLGSGPTLGGFAFGRDYSLDPYYYRYPAPFVRGTAMTPSEVEIYVNGALVRRAPIGPGPYHFDRLPLNSGRGDVRIVVRDSFGRQQVFENGIYLASGLLRKGDHDYRYAAGKQRDDTQRTPVYREWNGTAYHRAGLTDWITAGFSAEGGEQVVAGGPTVSLKLARLGEMNLEAWTSRKKDGTRGTAFYGVYTYTSSWLNLGATGQYFDKRFANLFLEPGGSSTPEFYQASAGVPVLRTGSVDYTWDLRRTAAGGYGFTTPDGSFDMTLARALAQSLRVAFRVFPGAQLSATGTRTRVRGERQWSGFVGLNVSLWRQTTASVTYSQLSGLPSTYADIDRSVPVGVGYGYRFTGSDVDGGTGSGQLEANLPFAHVRANYDVSGGGERQNGSAMVAGGVAFTGGGVFLTRELQLSSAVVHIPGMKNVRILADNVPIGRTDRGGHLLIPELLPYMANRISFDESDIPFDYRMPVQSQLVAPPFRGAAYVKFPIARILARTGTIRITIGGEEIVPSYGAIVVRLEGREVESPLNADGEFFLDLPDGHHTATVTFRGKSCTVAFDARPSTGLDQKLGTLRCAQ